MPNYTRSTDNMKVIYQPKNVRGGVMEIISATAERVECCMTIEDYHLEG